MTEETGAASEQTTAENLVLLSQPLAGPWPRFWARIFDLTALGFVVAVLLHGIGSSIFGSQFLMDSTYDPLVGLAIVPVSFLLDAIIQFVFGNSPGKAIAGIRVETTSLERPRLGVLIKRNLLVWLKGVGLGIPVVSLFTMMACYMTVRSGRLASWDAGNDVRVFSKSSNIYRTLLVSGLVLAMYAGLVALTVIASQTLSTGNAVLAEANENLPRQVDDGTRMDKIEADGGWIIYNFTLVDPDGASSVTPAQTLQMQSEGFRQFVVAGYCQSDSPLRSTPVRYRYRTLEGKTVLDLPVTPKACATNAP